MTTEDIMIDIIDKAAKRMADQIDIDILLDMNSYNEDPIGLKYSPNPYQHITNPYGEILVQPAKPRRRNRISKRTTCPKRNKL